MNPLHEAQHALQQYCSNLVLMLEQALEGYCNASLVQEKEVVFIEVKKYSSRLALLESFYCKNGDKACARELQKLCSVLNHENYQENDDEQVRLLTKIYQLIAQLPLPVY